MHIKSAQQQLQSAKDLADASTRDIAAVVMGLNHQLTLVKSLAPPLPPPPVSEPSCIEVC